ncbi:carbohydrate kinase family protein, partial [Patescibacteria group bacterium]|nr:carbohydrate kinase family protein [Patescibacteria group bacterium]
MSKIIVVGSATKDIFIETEGLKKGKSLCFPFGEKTEIKKAQVFSGGGGVNVATTFALQGLKASLNGAIGNDLAGKELLAELKEKKIDTGSLRIKNDKQTDLGIVFHSQQDRTIVLCHNASRSLNWQDIALEKIKKADWLYIAPLWGTSSNLTEKLINFAHQNKVKIALNPSLDQLALKQITKIINQVNVLILNSKEASFLTKVKPFQGKSKIPSIAEGSVIHKIASLTKAIIIITKGKDGAVCFDHSFFYNIPAQNIKVVDATGAGDSFGSGFVAGLIKTKNVENALTLGMANAIANIKVTGANQGLLKQGKPLL